MSAPFEVEDVLLALWVLVLERAILLVLGRGWDGSAGIEQLVFRQPGFVPVDASGNAQHWLVLLPGPLTIFGWVIVVGLLFVIFTRGPDDITLDDWIKRRILTLPPPFFYALHVWAGLAWLVSRFRGGDQAPALPSLGVRRSASPPGDAEATYLGPRLARWPRRLAVVPAALLGESAFRGQVLSLGSDFGSTLTLSTISLETLRAADGNDIFKLVLSVVLLCGAFAFLVAGPRIAAGAILAWHPWLARFALFVTSVVVQNRLPS